MFATAIIPINVSDMARSRRDSRLISPGLVTIKATK